MLAHDFLILFYLLWLILTSTNAQNRKVGLVPAAIEIPLILLDFLGYWSWLTSFLTHLRISLHRTTFTDPNLSPNTEYSA